MEYMMKHQKCKQGMETLTQQYHRNFLVGQGYGFRKVGWWAYRKPYPFTRGYGKTKQGAVDDLLNNVCPFVVIADDTGE